MRNELLRRAIENILGKCSRDTSEVSCAALQYYFALKYENHRPCSNRFRPSHEP